MIMAGHETTAKALTWTLYLLGQHPEVETAVAGELSTVLDGRIPDASDLPALVRTRAALDEAIRLFPPVWLLSRRAVADDVMGGERVPAGTLVCLSPWLMHRPRAFWPPPDASPPGRSPPGGAATAGPSPLYLPFGGGPRICLGRAFALTEATLVLATVL